MYYLFKYKNIRPSDFYLMELGEKKILAAFARQEIEDSRKEQENII